MRVVENNVNMLQGTEISMDDSDEAKIAENVFEHFASLEEADCYIAFLAQTYPGNGK